MSVTHKQQFAVPPDHAFDRGRTFIDPNPAAAVPYGVGDLVHLDAYDRSSGGVTLRITGPAKRAWIGQVCTTTWPAEQL